MPNSDNQPQIPKNQSAISTNGVVSRDWYRFFLNLLNTVNAGGGGNGTGTVTSINVSGGATGLTTSGGPITNNGTITLNGTVNVAHGGTNATTAAGARTNLGAAQSGANTDITSIALTTGTISTAPSANTDIVNKLYVDSATTTYTNGTGLSLTGNTFSIANTGTAGTYGSASAVPVLTTNAQGQVTSVTNTSIAISGSAVSGDISGSAGNVTGVVAVLNGGTGQTSYTDGQLLIGNSTGNTLTKSTLTAGAGISITTGAGSITINATNAGAVTSVTGTSPVVSSGGATPNISLASGYGDTQNPYASKTANFFLAAPNGTAGVPTFRAVVAADIPTLNQNTIGQAGSVANSLTAGTGISYSAGTTYNGSAAITINNSAPMVYPGAGIPNSTGTAWGTSYTTTGSGTVLALATSPSFTTPILGTPQSGNFSTGTFTWPTFNQNTTGTAGNVTGVVAITNGGTGQTTANPAFNALAPTTTKGDLIVSNGTANVRQAVGTDTYVLTANSSAATGVSWLPSSGSGATITNDTTTATNLYPTFAAATSGSLANIYTSNANYLYKPSTGELTSPEVVASNGMFVNNQTISANYTIPAGSTAISGGPITVASGIAVTVSSGARWVTV